MWLKERCTWEEDAGAGCSSAEGRLGLEWASLSSFAGTEQRHQGPKAAALSWS
jgi:hypothetical protein